MRKFKILSLTIFAFTVGAFVSQNKQATSVKAYDIVNPSIYYAGLSTTNTGAGFRNEIYQLMIQTHKRYTLFSDLAEAFKTTDVNPNNSNQVELFYTGEMRDFNGFGGRIDREHVWPDSKGVGESGPGADAHHLRPADSSVNSGRGNTGFGPGGYTPPHALFRGAAARIIFYVGAHYGPESSYKLTLVDDIAGSASSFGSLSAVLEWNLKYPVTDSEIRRNDSAQVIQGNRNPFIDHPEYACRIWGDTNAATQRVCAETQPVLIQPATTNAVNLIEAIGEVNKNSESKIISAEQAHDSLSFEQKELIYNYTQILTTARANYNSLITIGDTTGTGTLMLDRSKFPNGSLAYADLSPWTSTTTTGVAMSGTAHITSTTTQTEMQANTNNLALRNTTPLPGAISHITFNNSGGTPRSVTIYASSTASIPDGTPTSGGTNLGSFTPGGILANYTFRIDANKNYKYFYLHQTGGAAFYNYIFITFKAPGGPTPSELAAAFNTKVSAILSSGITDENYRETKSLIEESTLLSPEVYALINLTSLNQLNSLYTTFIQQKTNDFIASMTYLLNHLTPSSDVNISAIESEYGSFPSDLKALVDAAGYSSILATLHEAYNNYSDQVFADIVINMINALPLPEQIVITDIPSVTTARAAYEALSSSAKLLVTNYDVLLEAEAKIATLQTSTDTLAHTIGGAANGSATTYESGDWSGVINGKSATQIYLNTTSHYLKNSNAFYDSTRKEQRVIVDDIVTIRMNLGGYGVASLKVNVLVSLIDKTGAPVFTSGAVELTFGAASTMANYDIEIPLVGGDRTKVYGIKIALAEGTSTATHRMRIANLSMNYNYIVMTESINVSSVSLNKNSLNMEVGNTEQLITTILPTNATNKNIIYSTNNASVATVSSSGWVEAKSVGVATITVTSTDGGKTDTCLVTVTNLTCSYVPTSSPKAGNMIIQMDTISFIQKMVGHTYVAIVAKGAQYGSTATSGSIEFESSLVAFAKQDLDKIIVNMSTSGIAGSATLKVFLGNEQIGSTITLTNTAAEYTFIPTGTSSKSSHLRILAEGNGICLGGLVIYGGKSNIQAGQNGNMKDVYTTLLNANPCVDYNSWQNIAAALEALSLEEKELVKNALYVSANKTIETLGDKLAYMKGLALAGGSQGSGSNPFTSFNQSPQETLSILLVIITFGSSMIVCYYLLLKRKNSVSSK